jgi:hypothetical protein
MLSLRSGKAIALILKEGEKQTDMKKIYIKGDIYTDDDDVEAELETTPENKQKIFKAFLKLDKKLLASEVTSLTEAYAKNLEPDKKLRKKFEDAKEHVNLSLKKLIDFGDSESLFPIVEPISKKSIRVFISGQSGSGKSTFIAEFLKYNKPRNTPVFIFSPFQHDKSLEKIKNLIYIDLDEFEKEFERPFEAPDDVPPNSVVIFDDIESHSTRAKELMKIRDVFLERGRHHDDDGKGGGCSVLTVSHNPLGNNKTKASIRESQYCVLFPKSNPRDTTALLSKYFGYTQRQISEILQLKSRWVFVSKSIPSYFVGEHSVRLW